MSELYSIFGRSKEGQKTATVPNSIPSTSRNTLLLKDLRPVNAPSQKQDNESGLSVPEITTVGTGPEEDHAWQPSKYRQIFLERMRKIEWQCQSEVYKQLTTPKTERSENFERTSTCSSRFPSVFSTARKEGGHTLFTPSEEVNLDLVVQLGCDYQIDMEFFLQHACQLTMLRNQGAHFRVVQEESGSYRARTRYTDFAHMSYCGLNDFLSVMLFTHIKDPELQWDSPLVYVHLEPVDCNGQYWAPWSPANLSCVVDPLREPLEEALRASIRNNVAPLSWVPESSSLLGSIAPGGILAFDICLSLWGSEFTDIELNLTALAITIISTSSARVLEDLTGLRRRFEMRKASFKDFLRWSPAKGIREIHESHAPLTTTAPVADGMENRCAEIEQRITSIHANLVEANQLLISSITVQDSAFMKIQAERATTLTILAAIFLPLSLVTGIFGMNLNQINDASPEWWSVLVALVVVVLLAVLVVIVIVQRRRIRRAMRWGHEPEEPAIRSSFDSS